MIELFINDVYARAEASLQMLKDLNPYVDVNCVTFPLDSSTDLSFLSSYQCIVCTDVSFELLTKINEYCRSQVEQIKVIERVRNE